jgi:hypothetical protein
MKGRAGKESVLNPTLPFNGRIIYNGVSYVGMISIPKKRDDIFVVCENVQQIYYVHKAHIQLIAREKE